MQHENWPRQRGPLEELVVQFADHPNQGLAGSRGRLQVWRDGRRRVGPLGQVRAVAGLYQSVAYVAGHEVQARVPPCGEPQGRAEVAQSRRV
jgi:hypothetical protein